MNGRKIYKPLPLILAGIFLIVAISVTFVDCKLDGLIFFIFSGIFQGFYYGVNNYRIFHFPYEDGYYQGFKLEGKKVKDNQDKIKSIETDSKFYNVVPPLNESAVVNSIWVHLLCSISSSIVLYLLVVRVYYINFFGALIIGHLGMTELALFLISLLGMTGLLPMTLWFFARSGEIMANMIRK